MVDSSTVITPSWPTLSKASAISRRSRRPARRWWRPARSPRCPRPDVPSSSRISETCRDRRVDAALDPHRRWRRQRPCADLRDHGLGQDGGGGGAVTGDVVGLGGDLLDQLRTEVLVGVVTSISRAMVTPSLVIVGAPHCLSSTTLRPRGPMVTRTASARVSTPRSSASRASASNSTILGMFFLCLIVRTPLRPPGSRGSQGRRTIGTSTCPPPPARRGRTG